MLENGLETALVLFSILISQSLTTNVFDLVMGHCLVMGHFLDSGSHEEIDE